MPFRIIEADDPLWGQTLSRTSADISYQSAYGRFVSEKPHRAVMLVYEDELGTVLDVTVVKQVSSLPFYRESGLVCEKPALDLASPDYNGPIILGSPAHHRELLIRYRHAVDSYCAEVGVVTEFVRVHPKLPTLNVLSELWELRSASELIYVDLSCGYDTTRRQYRKGHKAAVKKAVRLGVQVSFVQPDAEHLRRFFDLYTASLTRNEAKSIYFLPLDYFFGVFRELGSNALLVEATVEDTLVSSNIFFASGEQLWYKFAGTAPALKHTEAHTFMVDRIIAWAADHGYRHLFLGGGFRPDDGPYKHKRGFSHLSAPVYHFKRVHAPAVMKMLCERKLEYDRRHGRLTRLDYFPSYWLC